MCQNKQEKLFSDTLSIGSLFATACLIAFDESDQDGVMLRVMRFLPLLQDGPWNPEQHLFSTAFPIL